MDRISTATKAVDLFGAGKHGFRNGDLAGGIPPTDFNADWFNGVQEELLAVIEAAGLVPAGADLTQLRKAIDVMIRRRAGAFCLAGGTVDAITGDFNPDITALTDGLCVMVRAAGANGSGTPTFKADGTAATTIVKANNRALVAGDIPGAGYWMVLVYDATLARWVLTNPAGQMGIGYMHVRDEKPSTTAGGNSIAGTQVRTLNTVVANTIPGASLASNQITLPAGSYRIRAAVPSHADLTRGLLYNVTDAAIALLGASDNAVLNTNTDRTTSWSPVVGRITIAAPKVFELRHYTAQALSGVGLGSPCNDGNTEIYSYIEIFKED